MQVFGSYGFLEESDGGVLVLPLVTQLRFTRSELVRCLKGVTAEDACRRIMPMNCLSWTVGHLAAQEQFLWLEAAQGICLVPDLSDRVGYGRPASTPPWGEMWDAWQAITSKVDVYLDTLTPEMLFDHFAFPSGYISEDIGTSLLRNIYHYWFHTGEAHAVRQMLGHSPIPQFVGGMEQVRHSL